jgi:hypothetical protein
MVTKRQTNATRFKRFSERNPDTNIIKRAGGQGWFVQMDLLAPVFAYLTAVAGIVGAFAVAFSVVVSAPKAPAIEQHSAAIVSATTPKATAADLRPAIDATRPIVKAAADNPPVNHVAPNTQKREAAPQPAAAAKAAPATTQKPVVAEARSKGKITRAQWRQIVQQERSKRLAYQQGADFESRFLGYAD